MMPDSDLTGDDIRQGIDEEGRRRIVVTIRDRCQVVGVILNAGRTVGENDRVHLLVLKQYLCGDETQPTEGIHLKELRIVSGITTVEFDKHLIACRLHGYRLTVQYYRSGSDLYVRFSIQHSVFSIQSYRGIDASEAGEHLDDCSLLHLQSAEDGFQHSGGPHRMTKEGFEG